MNKEHSSNLEQFFNDVKKLEKKGLPKDGEFNMSSYLEYTPCNTVACAAGWLEYYFDRDYISELNVPNIITDFLFSPVWKPYDNTLDGFFARVKYIYKEGFDSMPKGITNSKWYKEAYKFYTTPKGNIKKKYKTWD